FQLRRIDIDQHHLRTFTREYLRRGIADRAGRAGDEHGLSIMAFSHFLAFALRNGRVRRNRISLGESSLNASRACSGVSVALIGMVPKTLPLSTRLSPFRSIAVTFISSLLSAA